MFGVLRAVRQNVLCLPVWPTGIHSVMIILVNLLMMSCLDMNLIELIEFGEVQIAVSSFIQ